ncbi:hypothetical protein PIB30_027243 [Stylosanthes scabra]|uniref:Uncharacterized protein n=1 Tax=Stylosanthes scabra TaxID=79078 RepID=A0ABU6VCV3_9FABA|nr:hypothetical protein [Stylosanthes scabra]
MLRLNSDPNLLVFDPEIERTLKHARQTRRRMHFENSLISQAGELTSEENFVYSSASESDIELSSSKTGQPTRYPELNDNFELKSGLIKLLTNFHGLPRKDLIKHLKDFEVICTTTRRTCGDEDTMKAFAFLFIP